MAISHGALTVFGSGPGVGRNIAALFAQRGFAKFYLLSRDITRLSQDASYVHSFNPTTTIHEIPTDLSSTDHVQQSLSKINETLQDTALECVLFNAAWLGRSEFLDFKPASLEDDLKVPLQTMLIILHLAM